MRNQRLKQWAALLTLASLLAQPVYALQCLAADNAGPLDSQTDIEHCDTAHADKAAVTEASEDCKSHCYSCSGSAGFLQPELRGNFYPAGQLARPINISPPLNRSMDNPFRPPIRR
ncbi:MAG: hypothetical protein ACR2P6_04540 [Gammaproteobacteria bacterium]